MNLNLQKNIPFMQWIIEVAEDKIIEHRLLKKEFKSHEEFIIFTIIWMRVYKRLYQSIKDNSYLDSEISLDDYIKNFYKNQKDQYLGMTINAITRESLIPRSTVKRIIENLIIRRLVKRNQNRLIIPTSKVRDLMTSYRQFIFKTEKKNCSLFDKLELKSSYNDNDKF